MRTLSSKKTIAVIAAGAITLSVSGVAYAYWTTTGAGTGSATTATPADSLSVKQASGPLAMAPGLDAEGFTVTVTNDAENDAYVTRVVASIASVTKAADAAAGTCDATDYVLAGATMTNGAGDLAEGESATFSGATLAFDNKATNQDACKGATVVMAYAVS